MKKEEHKDRGLRQALQRRNEAAERMTLPEDFTDRLMKQIGKPTPALPKGGRTKSLLYWGKLVGAAIAASVVLLLSFHYLYKHEVTKVEQPVVVKQTLQHNSTVKTMEKEPEPMIAQEKNSADKVKVVSQHSITTAPPQTTQRTNDQTTDSLDYYIDKIERELAQVDESLYIERMNKVIRAVERLQRMVNSYILHTLDKEGRPQTAENMYNVKSEQDEE